MIKKFIKKLLGGSQPSEASRFGERVDVPAKTHKINLDLVDKRAIDVVQTLQDDGFEAYIVGGAVRDLLCGVRPKDFDVATDATPEQVKRLFRRAFIIGRRFRIVHVVYGRGREHEVIEVSTFRAYLDSADAQQVSGNERTSKHQLATATHAVDASGRVLRDNVWGPLEEDAARRDFTINAMYYDPTTQVVVDYHNGIRDARKRVMRMIGDPAMRYREDPVRIIRAVRFMAKLSHLGFSLDKASREPLVLSAKLLNDVPQSRLFDEMLKLLQTGHAVATVETLQSLGLAKGIYPLLDLAVARASSPFVHQALVDTDRRVGEDKPVAPSFLLACVLWSDVRDGWDKRLRAQKGPRPSSFPALQDAVDDVFESRIGDVSGRGKLGADMREIWTMQPRFDKRTPSSAMSLVAQNRFRAGFDFLRLRAQVGEVEPELAQWWETFSMASDDERYDMLEALRAQANTKTPRKRAPRTTASSKAAANTDAALDADNNAVATNAQDIGLALRDDDSTGDAGAPARKRRRRRRKPTGGDLGGDGSDTQSG
ncbi:polynucleotide adenylyltransferase PcnB [Comamonadaceae bacterium M7527]|nr:polynucleotide adenylyltransferase PcnB [Comamonadaceae bacterium M7527]